MRIGELARLSRTPARSLRYYEEQGLLVPDRLPNGYRDYPPHLVDRAVQVRRLIDSGVSTKVIALILPCLDDRRAILPGEVGPELLEVLREECRRMTERIDHLSANRASLMSYIASADRALEQSGDVPHR